MSDITEILSSDQVSASRVVINENFENLNTDKLEKTSNLSDLTNTSTARANLGLGNSSTKDIGTSGSQVAAGNHNHDAQYAPIAKGVTNGDSHDHNGGDGGQISHTTLSNIGTNNHAQIDTHIAAVNPHSGSAAQANVQIFTSTDTWTKPAGAKLVQVILLGGGGGGGSGRKGAATSTRTGGGGGSGSARAEYSFPASILGSTETVTVGAGGTGGASQATNSSNGSSGNNGTATSFGTWLKAVGGNAGTGGQAGSGVGGTAVNGFPQAVGYNSVAGASGSVSGGAGSTANATLFGPGGGGAGGGVNTSDAASNGGTGAAVNPSTSSGYNTTITGGTAGTVGASQNGGNGNASPTNSTIGGAGGGGGASSTTGNAGTGGNGGLYGAGGGGGGASVDSTGNSGAGGNGAAGIAIITTYF